MREFAALTMFTTLTTKIRTQARFRNTGSFIQIFLFLQSCRNVFNPRHVPALIVGGFSLALELGDLALTGEKLSALLGRDDAPFHLGVCGSGCGILGFQ
jgi:hypothetical protein